MTFLQKRLFLLLVLTMPRLFAVSTINYGDGLVLTKASTTEVFLLISSTAANAGAYNDTIDADTTVLQIEPSDGSNQDGTPVPYWTSIALRLACNNFWITLNPASGGTPYIRNTAPQPLQWEQLRFIPMSANNGTMQYGDQVQLVRYSDITGTVYVVLNDDGTSHTTSDPSLATTLVVNNPSTALASIDPGYTYTPYSQGGSLYPAISNASLIALAYTANGTPSYLYMNMGAYNAGYVPTSAPYSTIPFVFQIAGPDGSSGDGSPLRYGQPITLSTSPEGPSYFITMSIPSPAGSGFVRNNVSSLIPTEDFPFTPVWEQLYFISAYGYNNDKIYSNDAVSIARNALISGQFLTEYIAVDYSSGAVSTSSSGMEAATFTISAQLDPA